MPAVDVSRIEGESEITVRTVWEARLEEVVISARNLCNHLRQVFFLALVKIDKCSFVFLRNDHDLERPSCPPGTSRPKAGVLVDCPLSLLALQLRIIDEQVISVVLLPILPQVLQLQTRLFG